MTSAALIADRRRNRFPLNGGPRTTEAHRRSGRSGIESARRILAATELDLPDNHPVKPLTEEQKARAHAGLERARRLLERAKPDVER